jgi:uncharacterized glyoxalase superfamily protein PhnB
VISNRSVPTKTILPHVFYRNLEDAISWLTRSFGFTEHYRYGTPISGAQMAINDACIMLKPLKPEGRTPAELGFGTQSLTVFVEDLEIHHAKVQAAGVILTEEMHETVYGELQFAALDLEGHHWIFSRHAHDRNPAEWGAVIAGTVNPSRSGAR